MTSIVAYEGDAANRVVLNIGGTRFETCKNILKKIPATRLSRLNETLVNYDPICNEYFFDRHPGVFSQILNYYRTGKLHYPNNVCGPLFESELEFWGLDSNQVEPCCWKTYTKHRATEETLTTLDRLNIDVERTPKQDLDIKFGLINDVMNEDNNNLSLFKRIQPIVWQLFEEPRSSFTAKLIAFIQITMILSSILSLWMSTLLLSTVHKIKINTNSTSYLTLFRIQSDLHLITKTIDYITLAWFLIELTIRFIVSHESKKLFFYHLRNLIDSLLSLLHLLYVLYPIVILNRLQVFKVFRLFHLLKYHPGLTVIVLSIKMSTKILSLMVFFLLVASTLFGAFIFYAEKLTTNNQDNNLFISFIESFWYSVVSLTTIGYGDITPTTLLGRLFGSLCVLVGVSMVNLPMCIVVEILTNFYKHLSARSKLPKTRRRVLDIRIPRGRKMTTHEHAKIITDNSNSNKKAALNRLKLTIKTKNSICKLDH